MQISVYEVQPLLETRSFFLAVDTLAPSVARSIVLKVFSRSEPEAQTRGQREALLLAQFPPSVPFVVADVGHDLAMGVDFYALAMAGSVESFGLAAWPVAAQLQAFTRIAETLLVFHNCGIMYRAFRSSSFLKFGGVPIPYDFSRARRMIPGKSNRVPALTYDQTLLPDDRVITEFDPPEAKDAEYDGVMGDVYGLGMLMKWAGLQHHGTCASLVSRLITPDPGRRANSMHEVLRGILHCRREVKGDG